MDDNIIGIALDQLDTKVMNLQLEVEKQQDKITELQELLESIKTSKTQDAKIINWEA